MSDKKDKILMEFTVLWYAWERDSKACVVERPDGTRYLRMTNHGEEYEASIDELRDKISEYERVLGKTREALAMLVAGVK